MTLHVRMQTQILQVVHQALCTRPASFVVQLGSAPSISIWITCLTAHKFIYDAMSRKSYASA